MIGHEPFEVCMDRIKRVIAAAASPMPSPSSAQCPAEKPQVRHDWNSATPSPCRSLGQPASWRKRRLRRLRANAKGVVMECRSMIRKASDAERDGDNAQRWSTP